MIKTKKLDMNDPVVKHYKTLVDEATLPMDSVNWFNGIDYSSTHNQMFVFETGAMTHHLAYDEKVQFLVNLYRRFGNGSERAVANFYKPRLKALRRGENIGTFTAEQYQATFAVMNEHALGDKNAIRPPWTIVVLNGFWRSMVAGKLAAADDYLECSKIFNTEPMAEAAS